MADTTLRCAIADATGVVKSVVVCCGNDPSTCSLTPVRCPSGTAVAPGWTYSKGSFTPPPAGSPPPGTVVSVTTRQFVLQAQATTLTGQTQTLWQTIKAMFVANPNLGDVFGASSVIMRSDPMFLAAAAQLGISSAVQDTFFAQASLL